MYLFKLVYVLCMSAIATLLLSRFQSVGFLSISVTYYSSQVATQLNIADGFIDIFFNFVSIHSPLFHTTIFHSHLFSSGFDGAPS